MAALAWTQKQREIFELLSKEMSFSQVIEQGYAKATVSKVKKAIENGEKPPEPKAPAILTEGKVPMVSLKSPVAGLIQAEIIPDKYKIEMHDLRSCIDQYDDLQTTIGWESDYSSTLRESMIFFATVLTSWAANKKEKEVVEDGNR